MSAMEEGVPEATRTEVGGNGGGTQVPTNHTARRLPRVLFALSAI